VRLLLPILLSCTPVLALAQDGLPPGATLPGAQGAPPSAQDASAIAAQIIHQRALDLAGSGQTGLATELENLATGLTAGRISLADAALVMAIASSGQRASVPLTPEATAAAHSAESLLDGDAGAGIRPAPTTAASGSASVAAGGGAAASAPGTPALALPTSPPPADPKLIAGKIYAVDDGAEGKVVTAAIGVGTNSGVLVGSHFVIKRDTLTIARATVYKLSPTLSYASIDQNSLVDPRNDVREGDRAELLP
jgi:hypothetical protein